MSEYDEYQLNQNDQQPMMKKEEENHRNKKNMKKMAKKVGAIALSAVLFGGIAGGVFVGVIHTTGVLENNNDTEKKETTLQTVAPASNGMAESQSLDVSDIAESAMPSIVAITNKSVQEVQSFFSMFERGTGVQEQEVESQGSGIIIGKNEEELLIVTNNHVVADADTLSVCFIDDQAYEAVIKGTDSENDLAVIAVKLSDISEDTMSQIKIAAIGDSDSLKVGQQVVAIGNALGYGQSVTTGIISAVNRQVGDTETENGFIQTDAAINPGNSGGALLNMQGELVGINSEKLASTEVEGMGYAIPTSTASPIIEDLMNRKTRSKVDESKAAALGISGQTVDSTVAKTYSMPKGVFVAEVSKGSAAEKAGIQEGCIITKFDGTTIDSIETLKNELKYYEAGETVEIVVNVAHNGEYVEKSLNVTLDKAESSTEN